MSPEIIASELSCCLKNTLVGVFVSINISAVSTNRLTEDTKEKVLLVC